MYHAKFQGWDKLNLTDLLIAYRKAKADCYYERIIGLAEKFAKYEDNLLANLEKLLVEIQKKKNLKGLLKKFKLIRLYPKKINVSINETSHIYFSNSHRSFESWAGNSDEFYPEFRVIGDFEVDVHILSALWINMIGHKYDAILPKTAYASRLKRLNPEKYDEEALGEFHISAIGSFQPYFQPYQKWQRDGLKTIREELKNENKIIAISMDLDSYYHSIDPAVFKYNPKKFDLELDDNEIDFHNQFVDILITWDNYAKKYIKSILPFNKQRLDKTLQSGLVIGLTASRILANILLHDWDNRISHTLTPLHYGRYVDDMLLVILDPENANNAVDVMNFLQEKAGSEYLEKDNGSQDIIYKLYPFGKENDKSNFFKLQMKKQKIYVLEGQAGLDIVDIIQSEIDSLSSEYRLMPLPGELDENLSAKALASQSESHQIIQNLSHIDSVSIKRLGWALQLRQAETLANDLKPKDWKPRRKEIFDFARHHIITPENIFSFFDYLPRVLGLAIFLNEWEEAEKIIFKIYQSIQEMSKISIKRTVINGIEFELPSSEDKLKVWDELNTTIKCLLKETYLSHHNLIKPTLTIEVTSQEKKFLITLNKLFNEVIEVNYSENITKQQTDMKKLEQLCQSIAKADFNRIAFKQITKDSEFSNVIVKNVRNIEDVEFVVNNDIAYIVNELAKGQILMPGSFKSFFKIAWKSYNLEMFKDLKSKEISKNSEDDKQYTLNNALSFLFPTRPFSMMEISDFIYPYISTPNNPIKELFEYVNTFRGTKFIYPEMYFKDGKIAEGDDTTAEITANNIIKISNGKNHKPKIALTNFETEEKEWGLMACNKPDLSLDRYYKIATLINHCLKANPRPDYIVFPELSIPNEWVDSIARRLQEVRINLIAGTYYKHYKNSDKVTNQCVLILSTDFFGKHNFIKLTQYKIHPAVKEEEELLKTHGKTWVDFQQPFNIKPIYNHNDFYFGAMICSELQNSKVRIDFQGKLDALFTLSWNKDTESFASLIDASALDIHAYMILVNNRVYGDSRIRVPFKESYRRDVVRFRGGENDGLVISTINIQSLREFQSKAKRWTSDSDLFKTTPEGYEILKSRIFLPAK